MKIYYNDEDDLGQAYCDSKNCSACEGTGQDGETNVYGCKGQEEFMEDNWGLIISETNNVSTLISEEYSSSLFSYSYPSSPEA